MAYQQSALPTINHQQEKYNKSRKIKRISPKSFTVVAQFSAHRTTVQIEDLYVPYNIYKNEPNRTTFAPPSNVLIKDCAG